MPNANPAQILTMIGTMGASGALPGGGLYGGQTGQPSPTGPGVPGLHDILNNIAPGILGQTGGGISPQYLANLASTTSHQQGGGGSSQQALSNLQNLYPGLFNQGGQ